MLETSTEYSQGFGQVGYGDTAFKRWNMEVGVTGIVVGGKIKCRKRKIKCRIFATNYLSFNLKLKL
ncbi:hypothetical protein CLQ28_01750 [Campylobacter coli]|nr:hypothetical protein [Campylobacter coli]